VEQQQLQPRRLSQQQQPEQRQQQYRVPLHCHLARSPHVLRDMPESHPSRWTGARRGAFMRQAFRSSGKCGDEYKKARRRLVGGRPCDGRRRAQIGQATR
jgi:hypothetical protein